jgi:hypothetical protein
LAGRASSGGRDEEPGDHKHSRGFDPVLVISRFLISAGGGRRPPTRQLGDEELLPFTPSLVAFLRRTNAS